MSKKILISGQQYDTVESPTKKFFQIVEVIHISRKGKNGKKKKYGGYFLDGATSEPTTYFFYKEAEAEMERLQEENPSDCFELRCRGVVVRGRAYFT